MEYFCEKCQFTSKNKSDYNRHLNSVKHQKNTAKIYSCSFCNQNFTVRSTYYKHRKSCDIHNIKDSKDSDLKIKLILANCEKEKIQIKYESEQEKVKMLQDVIKNSNKTTDTALKITSKTLSALKYANEHFKDAPALMPIENYNIMNYDLNDEDDKKKLVEDILFYYRKNALHTLFGKHIISEYKKDDVNEQSLHTTDTSRMNYIVKTYKNNSLSKWCQDKNGIYVCNNVIDKLINYHIEILRWYHKILVEDLGIDPSKPNLNIQNKIVNISNLLNDIESGELKKETNKYIAPFFNLDK
jgi:hypothetical protein